MKTALCRMISGALFPLRRGTARAPRTLPYGQLNNSLVLAFSSGSSGDSPIKDRSNQIQADYAYCVNLVRDRDREGYLCGLLMPSKAKKGYFALRAFNAELASIKDGHNIRQQQGRGMRDDFGVASGDGEGQIPDHLQSENPLAGQGASTLALRMRMQWWRDALSKVYGDEDNDDVVARTTGGDRDLSSVVSSLSASQWHSPVVRALSRAHDEVGFTRRFLERLIDAREMDLEMKQFPTIQDLAAYSEDSVASLLYLTLECHEVRDEDADTVASHAGVGIGLTRAIRAMPFRLLHGEVAIPADALPASYPVQDLLEELYGGDDEESDGDREGSLSAENKQILRDAVKDVAALASAELARARSLQGKVPKHARSALLPVIPSLHFLSKLEKSNYDLLDPKMNEENRLRLLLLLGRTWLTGIF